MSQHIEHIEISNFKSIRHATIEGCKRINVFIGYPNVGKSAILEAMSALSYLQEGYTGSYSDLCRLQDSNELFHNAHVTTAAKITLNNSTSVSIHYISETQLELSVNSSSGLTNGIETWKSKTTFLKGKFSSKQDANNAFDRFSTNIVVKKYTFNNVYNQIKTSGSTLFFPFGENLIDVIHLNEEMRNEVYELFKPYGLKLLINPANNTLSGFRQFDEHTYFPIPFHQMADTLQRLIFHKAAIATNKGSVLLFEEPEAHMFPPYISRLMGEIIFERDNGNQYFINTHSPFVINDLLEDAREELAVYLVGYKDGQTNVQRLTDEELHEVYQYGVDLFFNIESYLN